MSFAADELTPIQLLLMTLSKCASPSTSKKTACQMTFMLRLILVVCEALSRCSTVNEEVDIKTACLRACEQLRKKCQPKINRGKNCCCSNAVPSGGKKMSLDQELKFFFTVMHMACMQQRKNEEGEEEAKKKPKCQDVSENPGKCTAKRVLTGGCCARRPGLQRCGCGTDPCGAQCPPRNCRPNPKAAEEMTKTLKVLCNAFDQATDDKPKPKGSK